MAEGDISGSDEPVTVLYVADGVLKFEVEEAALFLQFMPGVFDVML